MYIYCIVKYFNGQNLFRSAGLGAKKEEDDKSCLQPRHEGEASLAHPDQNMFLRPDPRHFLKCKKQSATVKKIHCGMINPLSLVVWKEGKAMEEERRQMEKERHRVRENQETGNQWTIKWCKEEKVGQRKPMWCWGRNCEARKRKIMWDRGRNGDAEEEKVKQITRKWFKEEKVKQRKPNVMERKRTIKWERRRKGEEEEENWRQIKSMNVIQRNRKRLTVYIIYLI